MEPVARTRSSIKVSLLHHLRNLTSLSISAGAHITGGHWTWKGDETLLKKLVAQHGAVIATVAVHGAFMPYKGGIFQGCTNKNTNHAVVVVGYGTENGVDYWLIKVKIFRCNILKCFLPDKVFSSSSSLHAFPYFLRIENSWGAWGEAGYMRLRRGVSMCGIGTDLVVVTCAKGTGGSQGTLQQIGATQAPAATTTEDFYYYG